MEARTFGPGAVVMAAANASQPTIREMSWTNDLTSFAGVPLDRSWLNLARKQGWFETWTFFGRVDIVFVVDDDG